MRDVPTAACTGIFRPKSGHTYGNCWHSLINVRSWECAIRAEVIGLTAVIRSA